MNIDTIIFDNDGVLLDTMPLYDTLAVRYLESLGVTPEPGLGRKCIVMSMLEGATYLQEHYALPMSVPEVLAGLCDLAYGFYNEIAPLKPAVAETLQELNRRGYRCMVATAGERRPAESAFKRTGIDRWIQEIHTCTEYRHSKSEDEFYLQLLKKIGRTPEQCLIVEDSPHAIATTLRVGFPVFAVFDESSADRWEETCARVWHAGKTIDSVLQFMPSLHR